MELTAKFGDILETLLLTPRGKVTLIEMEDFRRLDLQVFDRIAFHRSYMMIHEAIVLKVSATTCEIVVLERTKEDGPVSKGIVRVHKINLYAENGQLYRYDDRPTEADMPDILKRVLDYHGTEGYNVMSYNCQHLSSSIRYGNEDSHQTWWMILKIGIDVCCYLGIPLVSEKYENGNGGKDILGVKASAFLHLGLLAAECSVASIKVFRGRMSWRDFFNVMPRQLRMHILGLAGNSFQPILKKLAFYFLPPTAMASFGMVAPSFTVAFLLAFSGYIVADAVLPDSALCTDDEGYKNFRLASISAASISSFFAGFVFVTGWPLEAFVAMIGGYSVPVLGNLLYTEAVSWFSKETVGGGWIQNLADLNPGDHITTYRNFIHRYSHAIFVERASNNSMVVIRYHKGRGVIQEELKFEKDWIYRYNYPSSVVRSAQEVVAVAQSKIEEKYHHDCWSFAKLCKLKYTGSGESNAVSIDSIFDTIESDEFLSEKELDTYINNFDRLKKEMSNEYKEDDGTTQEQTDSEKKGTVAPLEVDIVETGCAYRSNRSDYRNELLQQGLRCPLEERARYGFICLGFPTNLFDTIQSDEFLVKKAMEAFKNDFDRSEKGRSNEYKEDDGTTQEQTESEKKGTVEPLEVDIVETGCAYRSNGSHYRNELLQQGLRCLLGERARYGFTCLDFPTNLFDTIQSDEFLVEKVLKAYIYYIVWSDKGRSNEYKEDDGTTQEQTESEKKGTVAPLEVDIVETGCAYRNNESDYIDELFRQGLRCLLGETELDDLSYLDVLRSGESNAFTIDSIFGTINSYESLVEKAMEAYIDYVDRLKQVRSNEYKEYRTAQEYLESVKKEASDMFAALQRDTETGNNGICCRQEEIELAIGEERDIFSFPTYPFLDSSSVISVPMLTVILPAAVTGIVNGLLLK